MKLPNRENAVVEDEKILDYLISESHPIGRFKAKVFRRLGFDETNVDLFRKCLKSIANAEEIVSTRNTKIRCRRIALGSNRPNNGPDCLDNRKRHGNSTIGHRISRFRIRSDTIMVEHDTVALVVAIPEHGLSEGDVGAIVYAAPTGDEFEVEFVAADGSTIALLTLSPDQIRSVTASEIIPHQRASVA